MDEASVKKSLSLETLVIQNVANVKELKAKLNEIVKTGKSYEYDVSTCIKSLLNSSDPEIVLLSVEAIAELSKCEEKRETYAHKDTIGPILGLLNKEITPEKLVLVKQCCRALGNLCCDCDTGRNIIIENNGVTTLISLLKRCMEDKIGSLEEIKLFTSKIILNFTIGGKEMCNAVVQAGVVELLKTILKVELGKDDINDSLVSTVIMTLSVINDNTPDHLFSKEINCLVLRMLKETTNMEISELCLDHLHTQAEHESVKTLLATEGGVDLVCSRLEVLVERQSVGDLYSEDSEVEAIMKQACDLVIIVLTGDEAMHLLYNNGSGQVYLTMVKWLDSANYNLLATAVLAIGNFARQDDYCIQMMEEGIYDKLLGIFEHYHSISVQYHNNPTDGHTVDLSTATKIQHAAVSAIRNLSVPVENKRVAATGRAIEVLLKALPLVRPHHVAYKLLACVRMLIAGQEKVAIKLADDADALSAIAKWGFAEYAGVAGEAPRLIAWCVKQLRDGEHWRKIVEVDGCVACLVNMLVASHSVMQNEAILSLTLLAIESLKHDGDTQRERSFISQLIKSEIGKHVSVLMGTNCAKMPVAVAENLLAFLDITSKNSEMAADYKEAKVDESLQKFLDTRTDLSDNLKGCISGVIAKIVDYATTG